MRIKLFIYIILHLFFSFRVFAQDLQKELNILEDKMTVLHKKTDSVNAVINGIKLKLLHKDLKTYGLPKCKKDKEIVEHNALILSYNEAHEQANWVAHIISKDIGKTGYARTNDFRPDPKVQNGSTEEKDFFLKTLLPDSTYSYDGYGYDRGHLAPSADFRWNKEAMSESYFYSNMSPQLPDFNRGIWAKTESFLREYVNEQQHNIYVVTGGILSDDLAKVERSINRVSIPKYFYKVALDAEGDEKKGIGFLLPHEASEYPAISFIVPIDSIEKLTGIDFFASFPENTQAKFESGVDIKHWQTAKNKNNVKPISRHRLPKGMINTIMARSHYDDKAKVCGTVVEVHETRNGNYFLNFDMDFPEQLFWCTIWKNNIVNFSYHPKEYLTNKKICVSGEVKKKYGKPSMSIYNEKQIIFYEDAMRKK